MAQPKAKFNLCIRNSRKYYKIFIWHTRKDMLKYLSSFGENRDCYAYCHSFRVIDYSGYKKGYKPKRKNIIGEVHFFHPKIGVGMVSHEMTHAAIYWFISKYKDMGLINQSNEYDEYLADIQGDLVRKFWNKIDELVKYNIINL